MGWKIGDKITVDPGDNDLVPLQQGDNTRNSTLARIKKFFLGDEKLKTTAQTITGAINENTAQMSKKANQSALDTTNANVSLKANKTDLEATNIKVNQNSNDIAVQKTRIDSFTSLAQGSTTGDAELIDARIGNNGVIYNSLGTAIREQNKNIKNIIQNNGIIKKINFTYQRGSIAGDTGLDENSSWNCRTDSYQVSESGWYRFVFDSDYNVSAYSFDETQKFVGRTVNIKSGDDVFVSKGSIRLVVMSSTASMVVPLTCGDYIYVYEHTDIYDYIIDKHMYIEGWSQGSLSTTTGLGEGNANTIKSSHIRIDEELTLNVEMPSNYYIRVYKYNADKVYIGCSDWISSNDSSNLLINNIGFIRFVVRTANWDSLTPSDYINVKVYVLSNYEISKQEQEEYIKNNDYKIENIETNIRNNGMLNKISFTYESGSIAGDTGLDENSSWNCRTDSYIVKENCWIKFLFNSDYNVSAYLYNEEKTFIRRVIDIKSGDDVFVSKGSIRLVVMSKNQSTKVDSILCSREFFIYERTGGYDYIIDKHMYIEGWSQGSLSTTTGLGEGNANTIKSSHIRIDEELTLNVEMPSNYYIRVYYYSLENIFLGCDNWISSKDSLNLKIKNNVYIRLLIRTSAWDDITTDVLKNINIYIPSGCKINEKQKENNTSKYNKIISNMIKTGLETGITVSPTKNLGAITSCPDVDSNGNVYVGLEACDDTAYESSETAYAELITFNIIHPEDYEVYEAVKDGDTLNYTNPFFGYKETVKFAWDTIAMKISDTIVRVLTKVRTNTDAQYLVYRDFNITTKTFGYINVLKAKTSNGDIVMWGNNNQTIRNSYNLTEIDTSGDNYFLLMNCRIERVVINNILYYYSFIGFGYKSHPLMRSTDLETWEFVTEFPIGFPTDEVQVALYNNKLYAVNRARWNHQNDIYVNEFDLNTNTWTRKLALYKEIHGQERPAIVIRENYMYVTVCDGFDNQFNGHALPRTKKRFYKVNLDTMVQEKQILVEPDIPLVYPEFFKVAGAIYVMSCMDKRGYYMNNSDGRQELSLSYFNYSLLDLVEN